ncbi:hypothetical protein ACLOJK_012750 [Asimina triloba]
MAASSLPLVGDCPTEDLPRPPKRRFRPRFCRHCARSPVQPSKIAKTNGCHVSSSDPAKACQIRTFADWIRNSGKSITTAATIRHHPISHSDCEPPLLVKKLILLPTTSSSDLAKHVATIIQQN